MTITTNPSRDEYTSTAGQTVFNYTFKIYANTDLNVYVTPSGQSPDDSADLTTDYVVDTGTIGDEAGGFITFNTPLNNGDAVTIVSAIPYDRTVDYQNNGDFLPETVNDDNDRQVSQIKQILEQTGRTLQFQESLQRASTLSLPSPVAGKFLKWKSDNSGLENVDLLDSAVAAEGQLFIFPTLSEAVASTNLVNGVSVELKERTTGNGGGAMWDVVLASTVTPNTFDIVQCTGVPTLALVLRVGQTIDIKQFGAIEGQDATNQINAATDRALNHSIIELGGDYLGTNITANKAGITYRNGKITAPLDSTESCFVVTADSVTFDNVDTFVDWANLTAPGTVNVGGIHANNVDDLRIIGGSYLGARSDSYGTTVSEIRSAINLYRCTNAKISPSKVGEVGFVDALGIWESYSCEVDGGLYENGQYSGIATATDEGSAPIGNYGKHIIRSPRVRGMGTSSITINDTRCQVITPDVDGGSNGVNFGHSAGQPGLVGIVADNSALIGGVIRNTTLHGVAVGNSKNIRLLGSMIEDTGGSGVRLFDNCDGVYIGAGLKIRRTTDTLIGLSIGDLAGSYTIDGVDGESSDSHGIYAIGGTELKIRNVKIKDVDNVGAGRNLVFWTASTVVPPEKLEISGLDYKNVNSASPANAGIKVDNSVADLAVDIHDCDLVDVEFGKFSFDVQPTTPNIYKNRLSTDPLISSVSFDGASTSQVVTNGNLTIYSFPKITYRDVDCHTRQIYVSATTTGSFTISGTTGSNADFFYEV